MDHLDHQLKKYKSEHAQMEYLSSMQKKSKSKYLNIYIYNIYIYIILKVTQSLLKLQKDDKKPNSKNQKNQKEMFTILKCLYVKLKRVTSTLGKLVRL